MVLGKDVALFPKGLIIGLHQVTKTTKEITEATKIGFSTVQCIIKPWKDSGQTSSLRKKCGRNNLIISDHKSVELSAFSHTYTMQRELKVLRALRNHLSEERGFSLLESIKIGGNGKRSCSLMSPDFHFFTMMGISVRICIKWCTHYAYCTSLWGQYYDLGLLQLVTFSFSMLCPMVRSVDLSILSDQGFPSMHYFFPDGTGIFQDDNGKSGSGSIRHHFHTWIGRNRVQTLTPVRISEMCWRTLYAAVQLSHHRYKTFERH